MHVLKIMAEDLCRSLSKEADSNMDVGSLMKQSISHSSPSDSRCDSCKSKKKIASIICPDCGDLLLCNECNRKIHQGSGPSRKHKFHDIATQNKNVRNETVHSKPSKNNKRDANVAQISVQSDQVTPKSLLLINGQEQLQVF